MENIQIIYTYPGTGKLNQSEKKVKRYLYQIDGNFKIYIFFYF